MGKKIDAVCDWLVSIANDNSHGYSQDANKRWLNPDVDCSSFTILSWEIAGGIPVKSKYGATYTGNMRQAFVKAGFKAIKYSKNLALLKGDILLNEAHHVVTYLGDGRIVHASGSETGGKYGVSGDQTGSEVCVRDMYEYRYGWDYVLRYEEQDEPTGNPYPMPTSTLRMGSTGTGVSWLQWELNEAGANLEVDRDFGKLTKQAVLEFQRAVGIEDDALVGKITRQKLVENKTKIIGVKPNNPYPRPTRLLKKGCKGDDVAYVQFLLRQKGYNIEVDKSFGKLTEQAVYDFQKKAFPNQPSEWDKIVGSKTLKALES